MRMKKEIYKQKAREKTSNLLILVLDWKLHLLAPLRLFMLGLESDFEYMKVNGHTCFQNSEFFFSYLFARKTIKIFLCVFWDFILFVW